MPPNFATEGIIIVGGGSGVCIDDPQLISGFFHRTDIKVSDGSKLRRNNVARWREREDAEAILPDDCSSIIQPPFCRRCSNVCRLSRSIRPRKSVDRSEDDSTGFDRIRCFGNFWNFFEKVLSINLRKGGERGSKFSFREARLHPSIKVVSFGSLPSVR